MSEFDKKAAEWDMNPMHWDRSVAIANEMKLMIPLTREMTALEYGEGTGITSFLLKDNLKEITMMDNSTQMINVILGKISETKSDNLNALVFDLESADYTGKKFDLIFTQMVLHHVGNIDIILNRFNNLLNPGGYLAIADLYKEDGSFHGDNFHGHNGFDIAELSDKIARIDLKTLSHGECFVIDRRISETETRQFPVFLLIAKKVH
jgi:ubiquinone/menaquinone biosynthesis C-methylase UbiE